MSVTGIALMLGASALAAFLTCLDTAIKSQDPWFALRTKEWLLLWLVNSGVACMLFYAAQEKGLLDPSSSFLGFFSAVFGYPLLLHTKLFSIRGNTPEDDKSAGPQFLLELADRVCAPGIQVSINEMAAKLVLEWRQVEMIRLGASAKDYLLTCSWPSDSAQSQEQVLSWVDELVAQAGTAPGQADANIRTLFQRLQNLGGLRATRWVLKQSKKK